MDLIVTVFVIFAAAKAAGEIFARLGLPAMVAEILVGIAIGPHVLDWVEVNQATTVLSELGIVVLLFVAGLETRLFDLVAVGRSAVAASAAGMAVTGGVGFGVVVAFGYSVRSGALVAVALAASSVGIAARAFGDLGTIGLRPSRVVLGAAVVDDVVALAVLPVAQGVGSGGWGGILIGLGGAVGFVVLVSAVGSPLARRHGWVLSRLSSRDHRLAFVAALALCLGLAALAEQVGLAALVGAFLAGMVLAETPERRQLNIRMEPLFDFLVPFFFVVSGASMDPGALVDAGPLFVLVLVGSTVVAKLLGCGVGALGLSRSERLAVGAGMVPRGEVALAVATAGLAALQLSDEVFAGVVAVVLVSSLSAPLMLKGFLPRVGPRGRPAEGPPEGFGWEEGPDPSL